MNINHGFADLSQVRIHYASAGKGELILFLHGFPEFWYMWKQQLRFFGTRYHAVAPDMRGYNLSCKPKEEEAYRIKWLVEDVKELVSILGYKKFILVGHDWGGAVSYAFALRYPELLHKLIIINAPHPGIFQRELQEDAEQQKASQYMLMLGSAEAEKFISKNHYEWLSKSVLEKGLRKGYFNEEDSQEYIKAWSQPGALTGMLNYYRAAKIGPPSDKNEPARGNYADVKESLIVKVPTLVIWGEWDRYLLLGNLEGLEKVISNLVIKRIPEASHWVPNEKAELVNRYMEEYLSGS